MKLKPPREGDVYKTLTVGEKEFVIKYGYYCEDDRKIDEPMPLFPDFKEAPEYTPCGKPLVTRIQDACEHYEPHDDLYADGWCCDCKHFEATEQDISVCTNKKRLVIQKPDNLKEAQI